MRQAHYTRGHAPCYRASRSPSGRKCSLPCWLWRHKSTTLLAVNTPSWNSSRTTRYRKRFQKSRRRLPRTPRASWQWVCLTHGKERKRNWSYAYCWPIWRASRAGHRTNESWQSLDKAWIRWRIWDNPRFCTRREDRSKGGTEPFRRRKGICRAFLQRNADQQSIRKNTRGTKPREQSSCDQDLCPWEGQRRPTKSSRDGKRKSAKFF